MVTEWAYAKVNLCLHVVGQREDGYHLLDSIVAFVGIADRLTAVPAQTSSLTLEGPFGPSLPAGMDNSVLQAASALAPDLPVAFVLEKHLPPASGIGGGSADAAAAVRAVLRLRAGQEAHPDTVFAGLDIAALKSLGADVPVCILSHPARMRGIGERLDVLNHFPGGGIVLVNPRVEVPTPAVFRALTIKDNPGLAEALPQWRDVTELADWLKDQRNDLETPAIALTPVISDVLSVLRAQPKGLMARMSGSGASCFALFTSEDEAKIAANAVQSNHPQWWVASGPIYPGRADFAETVGQLIRDTT